MLNLLIFSHSDYSFLWKIIEEYIEHLDDLNPIFISNKTNLSKPMFFKEYIEYDESLPYFSRWKIDILPKLKTQYLLIVHDVNIIVNCDSNFIKSITESMKLNNIHRCSLNVFKSISIDTNNIIETNYKNVKLCNLNNAVGNTFTPYDTCPAIWDINSFNKLINQFPSETYRNSELNKNLQNVCRDNFNIYGIQKTYNKIYYCLGRPYTEFFKILHLTTKNELTFPKKVYMDFEKEFDYIFDKYKLINQVKINNNYLFVLDNFKPL